MDFNSLPQGAPVYVFRTTGKLTFKIGTLKTKFNQRNVAKPDPSANQYYNFNTIPNANMVFDLAVDFDGKEEILQEIPAIAEVATLDDKQTFVSCSQSSLTAIVKNTVNTAKFHLARKEYYNNVIADGEEILTQIDPKSAEEKQQAKTICELKENYSQMAKDIAKFKSDQAQMLRMLQKMTGEKSIKNEDK